jgi:hypothetical protein
MFTIGFSLDDHKMYSSHRRRMNPAEIAELFLSLQRWEFKICKGLRQNEYLNSIAKDVILLYVTRYNIDIAMLNLYLVHKTVKLLLIELKIN